MKKKRTEWLVLLGLLAATSGQSQPVLELRPNVVALPAFDISIGLGLLGNPEIRFAVTTANLGDGALEFRGGETGSGKQNVYQRVFLEDGTHYDRLVGSFIWHPEHQHIHVEGYAEYILRRVGAPGNSQRTSEKTSFCVIDTDRINHRLPGASKKAVYDTCESAVQGMSVGWGDTYGAHLPGQAIDLTDLPDGDYELKVIADPKSRLVESDAGDNSSCVLLRIGVTDLTLNVLNPDGCDTQDPTEPVVVDSIAPNFGSLGSLVPVTVSGSGFAEGMDLKFENGSGARLSTSEVVVVDENTITAIVTIRKKGRDGSDNLWDVRVDRGVLIDGFMVLP